MTRYRPVSTLVVLGTLTASLVLFHACADEGSSRKLKGSNNKGGPELRVEAFDSFQVELDGAEPRQQRVTGKGVDETATVVVTPPTLPQAPGLISPLEGDIIIDVNQGGPYHQEVDDDDGGAAESVGHIGLTEE